MILSNRITANNRLLKPTTQAIAKTKNVVKLFQPAGSVNSFWISVVGSSSSCAAAVDEAPCEEVDDLPIALKEFRLQNVTSAKTDKNLLYPEVAPNEKHCRKKPKSQWIVIEIQKDSPNPKTVIKNLNTNSSPTF